MTANRCLIELKLIRSSGSSRGRHMKQRKGGREAPFPLLGQIAILFDAVVAPESKRAVCQRGSRNAKDVTQVCSEKYRAVYNGSVETLVLTSRYEHSERWRYGSGFGLST